MLEIFSRWLELVCMSWGDLIDLEGLEMDIKFGEVILDLVVMSYNKLKLKACKNSVFPMKNMLLSEFTGNV